MAHYALDTTFLIDLQHEGRKRSSEHGATAFLQPHRAEQFALPTIALGEYLEGFDDPQSSEARALASTRELLPVTEAVATLHARTARELRAAGRLIGTNDLWNGCTAKAANLPILTRNVDRFTRVPGLQALGYAALAAAKR